MADEIDLAQAREEDHRARAVPDRETAPDYRAFLEGKIKMAPSAGFAVDPAEVNPALKPFNRDIVAWAAAGGRRAIFASFGLHKTAMQIELMRLVGRHVGGPRLIVVPLGVRTEFVDQARRHFSGQYAVDLRFIRSAEEVDGARAPGAQSDDGGAAAEPIYLTNYETVRDGKLDPGLFVAASLDEAAVLRSFGSKTYQEFLPLFDGVRFRWVATATPDPNRYKELIHYAGFLGVMDTGQALTRFFQRDPSKAGNLTLYPHKEEEFWLWVNSWACFIQRPSDLGYSDEGYELPDLQVCYHEVPADHSAAGVESDGQARMFRDGGLGVVAAAREKRDSLAARVAKTAEIVGRAPGDHWLIWHDLEDERRAIEAAIPEVVSVYGSQDLEEREQSIIAFRDGRVARLAGKPIMLGVGCNFQHHCHKAVFAGIGPKFHDFIQAIYRLQRFGQTETVEVHLVHSEAERDLLRELMAKWDRHREQCRRMAEIIRRYGLGHQGHRAELARTIGVEREEATGERFILAHNDCVEEARLVEDGAVGLIVTSIPFANHYEYSASYNDFGHTDDNRHFWRQMDFLTPELLRILAPGRLACVHVKDRILFGAVTGAGIPTVSPFHAEAIFHFRAHGFDYLGMIQIDTDVVAENNQTYRLGYSEMCKDGSKMGVGSPEYLLLFHRPQTDRSKGYADDRVVKDKDGYSLARWQLDAHAHWRSSGDRLPTPDELAACPAEDLVKRFRVWSAGTVYDHGQVVEVGEAHEARGTLPKKYMALAPVSHSPWIWSDVTRMRTLNGMQAAKGREKHICPLQFDVVDRAIQRWSNPGDLVYDPFCGLGTVPVRAIKLGRRGRGSELNRLYWSDSVTYCRAAERDAATPTLFGLMGETEA